PTFARSASSAFCFADTVTSSTTAPRPRSFAFVVVNLPLLVTSVALHSPTPLPLLTGAPRYTSGSRRCGLLSPAARRDRLRRFPRCFSGSAQLHPPVFFFFAF